MRSVGDGGLRKSPRASLGKNRALNCSGMRVTTRPVSPLDTLLNATDEHAVRKTSARQFLEDLEKFLNDEIPERNTTRASVDQIVRAARDSVDPTQRHSAS